MKINKISQFSLFKNVKKNKIKKLISSHPVKTFQPGDYLLERNQLNNHLYLLLTGHAEVFLNQEDAPLNIIYSGESFGEISLLDGHPASAHVIALTQCQVLMINKKDIWALADKSHAFTINILHFLVDRLRNFNAQVEESIQIQHQMERKATIDALTGLYNRRWLDENFDSILKRCIENKQPLSYVMIDIDHFKQVNDQYGHTVGDIVLHQSGMIIKKHARDRDAAIRYGGEELVLLLPETSKTQALEIAERLRQTIAETNFQYGKNKNLQITISLGCSTSIGKGNKQQLMKQADDALYRAKNNGRNQVIG